MGGSFCAQRRAALGGAAVRALLVAAAVHAAAVLPGCSYGFSYRARDAGTDDASADASSRHARGTSHMDAAAAAPGFDAAKALPDAGPLQSPPVATQPPSCAAARFSQPGPDAGGANDAGASADDAGAPLPAPTMTGHPFLGAVTDCSMRIWLQSTVAADSCIEYWPLSHPQNTSTALGPRLDGGRDFTGTVTLTGLDAAATYGYRVWLSAPGETFVAQSAQDGMFKTASVAGAATRWRLIFGADIGGGPTPIFDEMQLQSPDLVLLLGDLSYNDQLAPTLAAYRGKARSTWANPSLARLAAAVPTIDMWDDHDLVDNFWPGKNPVFPVAHEVFSEYAASRNPDPIRPGQFYYSFAIGDVGVFVLDERSYRSPNDDPDGPNKTMLGTQQRGDLLAWLAGSPATVKIIASPVMISDFGTTGTDDWTGFKHEREEILAFVAQRQIPNVLLLSGDQHWTGLFRLQRGTPAYTFYEFEPTPLSKAPRGLPALTDPDVIAEFGGDYVYGVVDVDTVSKPARVDLTLCRTQVACHPGSEPAPVNRSAPFTVHLSAAGTRGWELLP